jgi:putative nucleotidyltransferase with HDIG domain
MSTVESAVAAARREPPSVGALIAAVSVTATIVFMLALKSLEHAMQHQLATTAEFAAMTLVLQLFAIPMANGGRVGVGAVGVFAAGIALGVGPALLIILIVAAAHALRARPAMHRVLFDAGMWILQAAAATVLYRALVSVGGGVGMKIAAAFVAGIVLNAVNFTLLCTVMGLSTETSPLEIWNNRFRWGVFHYLAWGPLALAAVEAHKAIGFLGLAAFMLPPGLLLLSVNQYVARTREALEEETAAKESYRDQSRDMQALFELASGLAVRSHDRRTLCSYAEERLSKLLNAEAVYIDDPAGQGEELSTGATIVARLRFAEGASFDHARWERIRPAVLPHLATAIESAALVERVWRTHLETIAALSRSMEAKDYYTGGHTERVAAIAVALARRLGFDGPELDALEVGALLHDIGKIGIPERILNKPDALTEEEWKVMKEHPIISDHILSEVDLHPVVRQVARHSHERYDGAGYPDKLAGEDIPLPSRIVLVADAVDALTTDRPYRPARHLLAALQEIREHSGSQFCPTVVRALEQVFREEPHVFGVGYLRAVSA